MQYNICSVQELEQYSLSRCLSQTISAATELEIKLLIAGYGRSRIRLAVPRRHTLEAERLLQNRDVSVQGLAT